MRQQPRSIDPCRTDGARGELVCVALTYEQDLLAIEAMTRDEEA